MYKLSFTLKQHTPIIHFQHDQDGATLRATEVKPKLDRFIIDKVFHNEFEECKIFLVGYNPQKPNELEDKFNNGFMALDYKMKIFINNTGNIDWDDCRDWKSFFGEMGKENIGKYKMGFVNGHVHVEMISNLNILLEKISFSICDFFSNNTFGARQSKGFGFFFPEETSLVFQGKNYYKPISKKYLFEVNIINSSDWKLCGKELFFHIDLFYRSLRAGINTKGRTNFLKQDLNNDNNDEILNNSTSTFYFKSLLFKYLNSIDIQWDKKTIKEKLFNNKYYCRFGDQKEKNILNGMGLNENEKIWERGMKLQIEKYSNEDILVMKQKSNKDLMLWRDLFGLSTEESWKNYGKATVIKTQAKKDRTGKWIKYEKKEETPIQRYKSPLRFFPLYDNISKKYYVYFEALPTPDEFLNAHFVIESNKGGEFDIPIGTLTNLNILIDWLLISENFDLSKHVSKTMRSEKEYTILNNVFSTLKHHRLK